MDSDLLAHPTQSTPAESLVSDPYASPPSPSARGYSAAFFGGATGLGHRTPILADTPTSDRLPSPPPPSTSLHPSPVPPLPGQISPRISPLLATNPQLTNADLTTVSQAQPHGALEGEEAFEASTKTHARNNSHSIGQPLHSSRSLKNKKSLPDLRQNHAEILSERQASMAATQVDDTVLAPRRPSSAARRPPLPQSVSNPGTSSLGHVQTAPIGLPPSGRKFSLPTASMAQAAADAAASSHASRSSTRNGVVELETRLPANEKGNPGSKGVAPVDVERNSYFRRLSTLPPSTISKAVPVSVLKFIDATRGVLFALSQIYTALKQYILFATDDRISGQFNRVLDIASDSMAHFINALDRFDSLSRRGTPEPCVIRGVLSACRESVGTFRKVVSVLQLQLRALQNSADVRFTRTLLLMLYGSMAEVGNSWQAMAPQVDAVLPFLAQGPPTSASAKANLGHVTLAKGQTGQPLTAPTLPSIAESTSPVKSQRSPATFQRPPRRRHAGSFSAHDVALGASIPPSAPAAQSFSLEELQASGSRSVRGRVGPPGNLGPLPVQPATAGPLSNSSFKDLFNHLDSLPPTPTVPVTPTSHPSYAFPGISQTPPPVPHPPHSRSATAGNESPARPNRSGSNGSSGDGNDGRPGLLTPLTAGGHPHAPNKLVMDAHLLELVHQVTSTALSVWSALLEHLASVGLKGAAGTTVESSISSSTLNLSTPGRGRVPRTNAQAHEQTGAEPDNLVSGSPRKLKDLRELAVSTGELTRRLQDTLKKVKEEEERSDEEGDVNGGSQGQPSVGLRKLWDESNQFVRVSVTVLDPVTCSTTDLRPLHARSCRLSSRFRPSSKLCRSSTRFLANCCAP